MGVNFDQCLLFEDCVQKVAEVQLSIPELLEALGFPVDGFSFQIDEANDRVNIFDNGTLVARARFFAFVPEELEPRFDPQVLEGKLVNCGWVPGELIVEVTDLTNGPTEPDLECINVNLPFQEIIEVPGLDPEKVADIVEFRKKDLGTITCLQMRTRIMETEIPPVYDGEPMNEDAVNDRKKYYVKKGVPNGVPEMLQVVQDPIVTVKNAFIAVVKVLGAEQADIPLCRKKPVCPPDKTDKKVRKFKCVKKSKYYY